MLLMKINNLTKYNKIVYILLVETFIEPDSVFIDEARAFIDSSNLFN